MKRIIFILGLFLSLSIYSQDHYLYLNNIYATGSELFTDSLDAITVTQDTSKFSDKTAFIVQDGSNNLSFTDGVTGTKTLAQLAAGGTSDTNYSQPYHIYFWDDMMYGDFPASGLPWIGNSNGAGSSVSGITNKVDDDHPYVVEITTGTTGNMFANLCKTDIASGIDIGGGYITLEFLINIEDLSTAGNEYDLYLGLGNLCDQNEFTTGCYFVYDRNTSVNWIFKTANGGARTSTTTSTAVAADTWIELRIEIAASGGSVEYFIDDVSQGTHNTNIPASLIDMSFTATTSAGTNRTVYIDYVNLIHQIDSGR